MGTNKLRGQVVRLAYSNSRLRPHLLPLLKLGSDTTDPATPTDRSAHPNVVEYALINARKGMALPAAISRAVKKLSGFNNMFLGPGISIITKKGLEDAIYQYLADMARKGYRGDPYDARATLLAARLVDKGTLKPDPKVLARLQVELGEATPKVKRTGPDGKVTQEYLEQLAQQLKKPLPVLNLILWLRDQGADGGIVDIVSSPRKPYEASVDTVKTADRSGYMEPVPSGRLRQWAVTDKGRKLADRWAALLAKDGITL